MEAKQRSLRLYKTALGRRPFTDWMDAHQDEKIWDIVMARLERAKAGNLGKTRSVGEGVVELKIKFQQGYRVYVGLDGSDVVLLRVGDKSSQDADIKAAKDYWRDYCA